MMQEEALSILKLGMYPALLLKQKWCWVHVFCSESEGPGKTRHREAAVYN